MFYINLTRPRRPEVVRLYLPVTILCQESLQCSSELLRFCVLKELVLVIHSAALLLLRQIFSVV